jgi:DNA-directed RNA polymerase beta' subunit/DNA-directed RNA polymerase subunit K/omega
MSVKDRTWNLPKANLGEVFPNKAAERSERSNNDKPRTPKEVLSQISLQKQRRDKYDQVYVIATSFSLFSFEEMRALAIQEVTRPGFKSEQGSLTVNDPISGSCDPKVRCHCSEVDCPGHWMIIVFPEEGYQPNPSFINRIIHLLQITCNSCSRLLIDKETIKNGGYLRLPHDKRITALHEKVLREYGDLCCQACDHDEINEQVEQVKQKARRSKLDAEDLKIPRTVCPRNPKFLSKESKDNFEIRYEDDEKRKHTMPISTVLKILSNISDKDAALLGYGPNSHPRNMILRGMLVMPLPARPPFYTNGRKQENSITVLYEKIVQRNEELKKLVNSGKASQAEISKAVESLAKEVKIFFGKGKELKNNRGGRGATQTIPQQLSGKKGTVRGQILSTTSEKVSRGVISPQTDWSLQTVVLPEAIFETQTQRFTVNYTTLPLANALARAGQITHVIRRNSRIPLGPNHKLQIGDQVDRKIVPGDRVNENRNPSIHRFSMMSHVVARDRSERLTKGYRGTPTKRISIPITTPYNADFDGDEMTDSFFDEWADKAEQLYLSSVETCQLASAKIGMVYGLKLNALTAAFLLTAPKIPDSQAGLAMSAYLLTTDDLELSPEDFSNLLFTIMDAPGSTFDLAEYQNRLARMIPGVVTKQNEAGDPIYEGLPYDGKALFSALLPQGFNYERKDDRGNHVLIIDGVLLRGQISGVDIGQGAGNIPHRISARYGHARAVEFINVANWVLNRFLDDISGFTIGINDLIGADEWAKELQGVSFIALLDEIRVTLPEQPNPEYQQRYQEFLEATRLNFERGNLRFLEARPYTYQRQWFMNQLNEYVNQQSERLSDQVVAELLPPDELLRYMIPNREQGFYVEVNLLETRYFQFYPETLEVLKREVANYLDNSQSAAIKRLNYFITTEANLTSNDPKVLKRLAELLRKADPSLQEQTNNLPLDRDTLLDRADEVIAQHLGDITQGGALWDYQKRIEDYPKRQKDSFTTPIAVQLVKHFYGDLGVFYQRLLQVTPEGVELWKRFEKRIIDGYPRSDYQQLFERIQDFLGKLGFSVKRNPTEQRQFLIRKEREFAELIRSLGKQSSHTIPESFINDIWSKVSQLLVEHSKAHVGRRREIQSDIYKTALSRIFALGEPTGNPQEDQYLERRVIQILQEYTNPAMKELESSHLLPLNNMVKMSKQGSGAKGDKFNTIQTILTASQQYFQGKRLEPTVYGGRCLPTSEFDANAPDDRGLCESSFVDGLKVTEYHLHMTAALEGTMNTALGTSKVGDMQRNSMRMMENQIVREDGSIRSSPHFGGNLTCLIWGGNGYNTEFMVNTRAPGGPNIWGPFDPQTLFMDLNVQAGWIPVFSDVGIGNSQAPPAYDPNSPTEQARRYKRIENELNHRLKELKEQRRQFQRDFNDKKVIERTNASIKYVERKLVKLRTYDGMIPEDRERTWFHQPSPPKDLVGSIFLTRYEIPRLIGDRARKIDAGAEPNVDVLYGSEDKDQQKLRVKIERRTAETKKEIKYYENHLKQGNLSPEEKAEIEENLRLHKNKLRRLENQRLQIIRDHQDYLAKVTLRVDPLTIARRELIDGVLPLYLERSFGDKLYRIDPNQLLLPPSFWAIEASVVY